MINKKIIRKLVDDEKVKTNSWEQNPTEQNLLGTKKS